MSNLILQIRAIVSRPASTIPVGVAPPTSAINLTYTSQTIAALLAAPLPSSTNILQRVLGRNNPGDCDLPLYRWDATSVTTHDGALALKPASINVGAPGRYLAIHNNRINCRWFGVVGDDITDDLALMQAAINSAAERTLVIPKGNYYLNGQLTIPSNTKIEADKGSIFRFTQSSCCVADSITDFFISGLRFVGTNAQIAIEASRSKNITIKSCEASCRLFIGTGSYSAMTDADLNSNIKILNNICIGTNKLMGDAAIFAFYCKDVLISENYVEKYAHGIAWWGGDSNQNANGAEANPRKCKDIVISNNNVFDINGGGIWGSMGKNVVIDSNCVRNCNDVGIDFEGTHGGVASSNVVENCTYGCLATFFFNKNISFIGNYCSVDNPAYPLWRNYNSSLEGSKSQNILFEANQFVCNGNAVGIFDCGNGPATDICVSNNIFSNAYIALSSSNLGACRIVGNTINVSIRADNRPAIAVEGVVGSSFFVEVLGNKCQSSVAQPNATAGIYINHSNINEAQTSIIKNNLCIGFLEDISCVLTSANAGVGGTFIVQDNIGSAGAISIIRAINAGVNPTAIKSGNIKLDGTPS